MMAREPPKKGKRGLPPAFLKNEGGLGRGRRGEPTKAKEKERGGERERKRR
jgi:hypothetical protein